MTAPAPDSLQGPGFWGGIGNFLTGKPTEQRGRPVMVNGEWRVPKYDGDSRFTGYGTLDPVLDARWGPGKLQADAQDSKRESREQKLEGMYRNNLNHQQGIQTQQLQNQTTQIANANNINLATLQQQIAEGSQRHQLLMAQLAQQGEQAKDANAHAAESLRQQTALQGQALGLKGQELQANIAFQQDEMNFRREQLADLRGSRKLAVLANAANALLAGV
jgi:hypothetical protein